MTGNCAALQTLADEPGRIQIHPKDADALYPGWREKLGVAG